MFGLEDAWTRLFEHLVERPDGPMAFRFLMQPLMAATMAFRAGLRDARTGAPPYILTIIIPSERQRSAVIEGVRAIARVMIFAAVLDAIYQIAVYGRFYPGETVIVVLLLTVVPYVLFRGLIASVSAIWRRKSGFRRND